MPRRRRGRKWPSRPRARRVSALQAAIRMAWVICLTSPSRRAMSGAISAAVIAICSCRRPGSATPVWCTPRSQRGYLVRARLPRVAGSRTSPVLRSGHVRRVARTVSAAVRTDRRMEACGHGHIADSVDAATSLGGFCAGQGRMKVEAGAYCKTVGSAYVGSNPTPATPARTACWLRKRSPAGRFLLVTMCIRVRHCGSMHGSLHVRMADSVRAERAVRITARFADPRPFCPVIWGAGLLV